MLCWTCVVVKSAEKMHMRDAERRSDDDKKDKFDSNFPNSSPLPADSSPITVPK